MTLKAQIYKDVVEELQLLDDARRALRDGDAVQAGRSLEAAREERLQALDVGHARWPRAPARGR